jgi:molecular chaperone GrpE
MSEADDIRPGNDEAQEASAAEAADAAALDREFADLQSELRDEVISADSVRTDLERLELELAERTADVQRLQAEYVNYRRRVERDRELAREQAIGGVMSDLLTVLDDIDRADEHGELVGGFRSVADGLLAVLGKLGLERYGAPGELFDPNVHEALTHEYSAAVEQTTCVRVFQPGYRFAERVLRPARVAVAEPGQPD